MLSGSRSTPYRACLPVVAAGLLALLTPNGLIAEETLWRVTCESALKPWPDQGREKSAKPKGWIKAKTRNGYDVDIWGELEDGYVQVTRVGSKDPKWALDRGNPYLELRKLCRQTLSKRSNGDNFRLGLVRTSKGEGGVYTSFVFDEWADREPVSRLVVFGDSLSDTGNLRRKLKLAPKTPYWLGRFTNGPAWTDYLEVGAGLALQNHAVGGAMSGNRVAIGKDELIQRITSNGQFFVSGSIDQQIEDYRTRYLQEKPLKNAQNTIAVIWGGANDYISKEAFTTAIMDLLRGADSGESYVQVVSSVADSTFRQLERLRELGLRRLLLITLPDLGLTPMVLHNSSYLIGNESDDDQRRAEFSTRLSELTKAHNDALAKLSTEFNRQYPDSKLVLLDANKVLLDALEPTIGRDGMGFILEGQATELSVAPEASLQDRCYSGMTLGLLANEKTICEDASRAIFWDLVHPSSYFHCWIAYTIGQALHEAGWIGPMRDRKDQRNWCEIIADAY